MPTNERDRFSPRGRSVGSLPKEGAPQADRRYLNRRPIPGTEKGADTVPDTSYDTKFPPFRRGGRKVGEESERSKSGASSVAGKTEKRWGTGWRGLAPRPLYGDPKDQTGGSNGAGQAQRDQWDILSGDDLLLKGGE